jgi:hypothetical protein
LRPKIIPGNFIPGSFFGAVMGELLKPRVLSKEQAKQKLDADIQEAHARYERRMQQIEELEAEMAQRFHDGEPKLAVRARNSLRMLFGTFVEEVNVFGRTVRTWKPAQLVPKDVAEKVTASQILALPNAGHKTVNEVAIWLRYHGFELKP